jgi:signal peptidase I
MDLARTVAPAARGGVDTVRRPLLLRVARGICSICAVLALGVAVGLTGALLVPSLFGYNILTVISGSMEPTLEVGSIVVDERIAPLDARPGDIVSFHDPSRGDRLVTHRLQSVRADGRIASMVTKGDANNAVERWSVPTDGEIGRVVYHVPKVGYVRGALTGIGARLGLLLIALGLGAAMIFDVWRRA